jgi:hypothetical protein
MSNLADFDTAPTVRVGIERRVKQMAILCEEISFQPGMLEVVVTDYGLHTIWRAHDQFDSSLIEKIHRLRAEGSDEVWADGAFPFPAPIPIEPVRGGFIAEFKTLLEDSGLAGEPWVHMQSPPALAEHHETTYSEGGRLRWTPITDRDFKSWEDVEDDEPPRSRADFMKSRETMDEISANLLADEFVADTGLDVASSAVERDLLSAAQMGVAMAADGRFATELTGIKGLNGALALELLVPDFARLSWEDAKHLHHDPAISAFRAKLQEAEEAAEGRTPDEQLIALRDYITRALLDELAEAQLSWKKVGLDVGGGFAFDFLPQGGTAFSAIKGAAQIRNQRRAWTAVLIRLHRTTRS